MTLAADKSAKVKATLRNAGVRITRQRIAVMAVLVEATSHPDAEELYRDTKKIEPAISLATVYRELSD